MALRVLAALQQQEWDQLTRVGTVARGHSKVGLVYASAGSARHAGRLRRWQAKVKQKWTKTFIGGKARNMHLAKRKKAITGRGPTGKTVVMGMLERGGKVRAHVIAERDKKTLHDKTADHVEAGSHVMTDELVSYWGLQENYTHSVINHAEAYVDGIVSTNGLENFRSLLKRALGGTYVAVEPFHLFRYIDEQSFRYNNRGTNDAGRFIKTLSQVTGKRLTFAEVRGRGVAGGELMVSL